MINYATTLRPQYNSVVKQGASALHKKRKVPRHRLNHEQRQFLEQRFRRNPNWSTEFVKELANRLNITFQKVYKWNWDRRQKEIGN